MARPKGQPKLGGRKKGTPNKVTVELRQMVLNALDKAGGENYLLEQARANPTAFLTILGKVLPMQVNASVTVNHEDALEALR